MMKCLWSAPFGIALSLALAGSTAAEPPSARERDAVALQLTHYAQFQFAGYYAALAKGFYAQEGLDVRILEADGRRTPGDVVLAGDAQYGVLGSELMYERLSGAPLVVLAVVFQHSPYALLALEESGIETPADLVGRRLMLELNERDAEFMAVLFREGVPLDRIHFLPNVEDWRALESEDADAMGVYVTDLPRTLRDRGRYRLLRPVTYGVDFYGESLFTTEDELAEHPARVERFRRASLRGWEYAFDHAAEIADLLVDELGAGERGLTTDDLLQEAEAMRELVHPGIVEIGHMNPGRWSQMAQAFAGVGMAAGDSSLDGFVYQPPAPGERLWLRRTLFVGGAFGLALALVALGNVQLRRKIRLRRRELDERSEELREESRQREVAVEALADSEERARHVFEQASDGFVLSEPDGRIVDVNRRACEIFGYSRDSMLGKRVQEIAAPEETDAIEEALSTLGSGEVRMRERRVRRRDGSVLVVEVSATRLSDGRVHGIVRDISARRRAEEAIRKGEERFRIAARTAGALVYEWDVESGAMDWFGPVDSLVGEQRGAVARQRSAWIAAIDPGDRKRITAHVERALRTGGTFDQEYSLRTRGGELRQVLDRGQALTATGEEGRRWIGAITDVTERHRLESQLRQAHKMESIGRLAGGIAHDFNNLLTVIGGFAELAVSRSAKGAPHAQALRNVLEASSQAAELTRQLLAFARRQIIEARPVEVNTTISDAEKMLRRLIPEDIHVETLLRENLWLTRADGGQITQVLMNLAANARDAMPDGGRLIVATDNETLDVERRHGAWSIPAGDYVSLSVRDTGVGLSDHVREHLFEPFFTTKARGKGTGLGLATSYGIVKQSGGFIWAESEPDTGTILRVLLPRLVETQPVAPAVADAQAETMPANRRGTVLVVEDDDLVRSITVALVAESGFRVLEAADPGEALRLAGQHDDKIDLLLTDVVMPRMSGRELADRLLSSRPELKVLYVSGHTDDAIVRHGILEREIAFLQKPFTRAALLEKMDVVLNP